MHKETPDCQWCQERLTKTSGVCKGHYVFRVVTKFGRITGSVHCKCLTDIKDNYRLSPLQPTTAN
jgi:hypothetical protein